MGYSISCIAKNKVLLLKMWEFLQEHYVEPAQLFNQKDNYSRLAINIADSTGLSYDHRKNAIGFDYNACEPERDYIFLVVKWMAIKIGKTIKIKNVGEVPYYIYDGNEKCPIFVKTIWNKIPDKYKSCIVDDVGFKSLADRYHGVPSFNEAPDKKAWLEERLAIYFELTGMTWQDIDKKIHIELKKLDKAFVKSGILCQ